MSRARVRTGMTKALAPHHRPVDVRKPGIYQEWFGKRGLTCLMCDKPVNVYQRGTRPWVRHNADVGNDQRCAAALTGPEGYEHELLKYWVRDRLEAHGYKAFCEQRVNASQPDVRAEGHGRWLAVEVQLARLSDLQVQTRTAKLRAEDHEVLWLTRHCNWVAVQPAVGLRELEQAVDGATPIGERSYLVRDGVLTPDPHGELVGGRRDVALETFLDLFAKGRIGWAMLHDDRYGWAVTEDWQRHLERQARRITDLETQLQQAVAAQNRLKAVHVDERRELTSSRSALAALQTQLQVEQAQARAIAERLEAVRHERDSAVQVTEQQGTRLQALQARLSKTPWGRRVLRQADQQ